MVGADLDHNCEDPLIFVQLLHIEVLYFVVFYEDAVKIVV